MEALEEDIKKVYNNQNINRCNEQKASFKGLGENLDHAIKQKQMDFFTPKNKDQPMFKEIMNEMEQRKNFSSNLPRGVKVPFVDKQVEQTKFIVDFEHKRTAEFQQLTEKGPEDAKDPNQRPTYFVRIKNLNLEQKTKQELGSTVQLEEFELWKKSQIDSLHRFIHENGWNEKAAALQQKEKIMDRFNIEKERNLWFPKPRVLATPQPPKAIEILDSINLKLQRKEYAALFKEIFNQKSYFNKNANIILSVEYSESKPYVNKGETIVKK